MKRLESRSNLSRYVAAARDDVPDLATLERAFGPLTAHAVQESSVDVAAPAAAGSAGRVRLVKLGGAGLAILLTAVGALFFARAEKVSNPGAVPPRTAVRDSVPAARTPSEPVPAEVVATPPVGVSGAMPPSAAGSRRRARHLDSARTPAQPREPRAKSVQAASGVASQPLTAANVGAESALIESARRTLRANPTRTLELAAEHERRFGSGLLSLEREALAIHALALLGREREARARLHELQRAHPRSIHVTRLERVLGVMGDSAAAPAP